ncbi:hypothetical protein CSUI_007056 [Cystoisospora suis]|uniref:Transmembrane protein n=1 Tax=Cystoisospora suis TaxID=483139 RepID=A0A2C6KF52_9APIC|nr:hypothetical protein CSUI_007056 [Cystoisospora suis]
MHVNARRRYLFLSSFSTVWFGSLFLCSLIFRIRFFPVSCSLLPLSGGSLCQLQTETSGNLFKPVCSSPLSHLSERASQFLSFPLCSLTQKASLFLFVVTTGVNSALMSKADNSPRGSGGGVREGLWRGVRTQGAVHCSVFRCVV